MPVELFTPEKASELSKLGWEKTRKRQAELLDAELQLKALRSALASSIVNISENERVKALEVEMADALAGMKGSDESKKAKLSAHYEKLFKVWQVLTGTANPGVRKSGRRERPAPVQPIQTPLDNTMSNPALPAEVPDWHRFTG